MCSCKGLGYCRAGVIMTLAVVFGNGNLTGDDVCLLESSLFLVFIIAGISLMQAVVWNGTS